MVEIRRLLIKIRITLRRALAPINYMYEFSTRSNKNPRLAFWHRSEFLRDILLAKWNWKYRTWIRFAKRNHLHVNVTERFLEERKDWPIWPT